MQPGVDDVVFMNITYPNKVMANIHVSSLNPQKVRKMIVSTITKDGCLRRCRGTKGDHL